ncbi:hypothetical protein EV426DRAFT_634917 [Tirmania nivea]|nr:hypothetical protein EV426DRAFT_634917 [Tirmania nivea]
MFTKLIIAAIFAASTVAAQSPVWGQCGGIGWPGATTCASSSGECQPDAVPASTTPSASLTSTTATPITPSGTAISPPVPTLTGVLDSRRGPTQFSLISPGNNSPVGAVGNAVLKSGNTAGQFNLKDGQLVQLISAPGTPEQYLYGTVTQRTGTEKTLLDTLQWSVSDISRPNNAAWLVCEDQNLYVNLGPYAYQTPTGCADQTIHYYNGGK